jgi:hypothetical protein
MGATMTYLWHITLNTGDTRKSPRSEVTDAAVTAVLPHMRKALAGSLAEIPFVGEGYRLKATAEGAFLLGTIMVIGAPALTFGVAPESRDAAQLWKLLHRGPGIVTEAAQPPAAPWLGVRIDVPHLIPSIAEWAADYERCVAWAWVLKRDSGHIR